MNSSLSAISRIRKTCCFNCCCSACFAAAAATTSGVDVGNDVVDDAKKHVAYAHTHTQIQET